MPEPRSYLLGLPTVITVHDNGRVSIDIDLSEADSLWDSDNDTPIPDAQIEADIVTVGARVQDRANKFSTVNLTPPRRVS